VARRGVEAAPAEEGGRTEREHGHGEGEPQEGD
jgi:hypothetical protein